MPKVSSSSRGKASAIDKENDAPTMMQYARRQRQGDQQYGRVEDRVVGLPTKSSRHATSASRHNEGAGEIRKDRNGSSSSYSKDSDLQKHEKHALRQVEALDDNIAPNLHDDEYRASDLMKESLAREIDNLQSQLEELRSLRMTEPERLLSEWRKSLEQKNKKFDDYIAVLKRQIETLSQSSNLVSSNGSSSSLQKENEETRKRQNVLLEENARQAREIERLRAQVGQSLTSVASRAMPGSSTLGAGDEMAVRRLYEDLTGLVINKVESIEGAANEDFRRFHAIFACAGYYDLEIKLEESVSNIPSTVPGSTAGPRADLIYIPTLDEDRDAELLQSGILPEFFKDSIRFERATAVKFMSTLHKRLDRNVKR